MSRPRSAAVGRPSSVTPSSRRGSTSSTRDTLIYECKAAYLTVFDQLEDDIESSDELYKVLQQVGRNPTKKMMNKYWTSKTDYLTFEDFCDICRKEPPLSADDLRKAFRKIDLNGDGYVTNAELSKFLTTRGDRMTREEVQAIIDEVDENRDGRLDYKEFIAMTLKTQEECQNLAIKNMERKLKTGSSSTTSKTGPSPKPARRDSAYKNDDQSSSRGGGSKDVREWTKPGIIPKQLVLAKPKTLRDWKLARSKGCFFFNEHDKIISHQFHLKVSMDTAAWITIEPLCVRPGADLNSACEVGGNPMDVMLFVLGPDDALVAFTEQRADAKGKYALNCDLKKGVYKLLAFTTGCRFKPRLSEPRESVELVRKPKNGKATLTKPFREALGHIFDMCDLHGNGLMSREEFNWYNIRTCGQEAGDEEWKAVEDNVELTEDQMTRQGFLSLNEMEAEQEDTEEEFWQTLSSMGFNRALVMDEASPFLVEVYTERGTPSIKVIKLDVGGKSLTNAIVEAAIRKGEASKVRGSKDIYLHSFVTDFRASFIIENQSSTKTNVIVDCSRSSNVTSHLKNLSCSVDVPPRSAVVAHHLMPVKESHSWTIVCRESIKE